MKLFYPTIKHNKHNKTFLLHVIKRPLVTNEFYYKKLENLIVRYRECEI